MALPSSGNISFSQINTELGLSTTTIRSLGAATTRTLFAVASGPIKMSNGYGKSSGNANIAPMATGVTFNTTRIGSTPAGYGLAGYGSGLYIAISDLYANNGYQTSPNLVVWTSRTKPANTSIADSSQMQYVLSAGKWLWILMNPVDYTRKIYSSTDAINWTLNYDFGANSNTGAIYGMTISGNTVIITSGMPNQPGTFVSNNAGTSWTYYNNLTKYNRVGGYSTTRQMAWGNGTLVATDYQAANNHPIYTSTNSGQTWSTPTISGNWGFVQSVAYGNGRWIAFMGQGLNNTIVSTDSINWSAPTHQSVTEFASFIHFANIFMISGYQTGGNTKVYYSTDGNVWTPSNPLPEVAVSTLYLNGNLYASSGANIYLGSYTYS